VSDLMQDMTFALARGLVEKTDQLILNAINEHFGMLLSGDPEQVVTMLKDRLHCVKWYNQTIDGYVETYELDGVPFFDLYPIETRMDGHTLITERKYRNLK
jgi:hypothetical protein